MNADASRSVAVDGRFALTVPHLFAVGIGVLIVGIVVLVIGVVLLVVGIRMRAGPARRPQRRTPVLRASSSGADRPRSHRHGRQFEDVDGEATLALGEEGMGLDQVAGLVEARRPRRSCSR